MLSERRTIRKYLDREIPEKILKELLEESFHSSTMGNMQLYSVIVTHDKKMKRKLSPLHFNQPMVNNAPIILTFCADFRRFSLWCKQRKALPGYNNFMSFYNASMDTLLVAQTFSLLAESAGMGICYLGTTTYNPEQIIELLELPKLVFPVTTITVGYPDECPPITDRLPIESIIHEETYHDYSAQDIENAYKQKESLSENILFTKENNKETLAQVFTDIRYTKKNNELMSENLIKVLKKQLFL